jgi:3-oxoacyl-[acyl-carrier protein] reductase
MVKPLEGMRVLVTGAAGGIGGAALIALRDAGAAVVGLDLSKPDGETIWAVVDLTDEAQIISGVATAVKHLGGLDVLVNCAGIETGAPLRSIDIAAVDRMYEVNVRGAIITAREALKAMKPGARIINIASELAYLGRQGTSGYCSTKGAMLSLTRSWARELAPDILVNAVAPGPIDTPLLGFDRMNAEQQALETRNPMGRIGRPEEVAAAIVFLASPAVTFTTGQCISVDGGAAMH